jgi:hypothetical protein
MNARRHNPDDPARAEPPPAIAELLAGVARDRGWVDRLREARIHTHWPAIAGDALTRHTEPVRLHGGVLVVRVESAAWATQLRYLSTELMDRANAVLGAGSVTRVTVVTGPVDRPDP